MRVVATACAAALTVCSTITWAYPRTASSATIPEHTSEAYKRAIGEALASVADGDYRQAGQIAQDASELEQIARGEAAELVALGSILYMSANEVTRAAMLASTCPQQVGLATEAACSRARAALDLTPVAAQKTTEAVKQIWLQTAAVDAPAWVLKKLEVVPPHQSAALR